jgi:hypothetical protein
MTEHASDIIVLAYILIVLIVLVFFALFGLRTKAIWLERQTDRYLRKHQDYFDYVKSHLHEDAPLRKPAGTLTKTELKVIQQKLFEWMEKIVGAERDKLTDLCVDLGLVELNMRRLRSEIHWTRLDAAYNLGVMQAREAVPSLAHLLGEEKYGSSAFVIARAISKCAESEEEIDRMVRNLAKFRKQSHRLVAEVLALSRIDCTALLTGYLQETDEELVKIALTGLQNRSIPGAYGDMPRFLHADDPELRLLAVQAIISHGTHMTAELMRELMHHEDAAVRAAVAEAFGRLGMAHTVDLLKAGMMDADRQVRLTSARSLLQLEDTGFKALCELAQRGEEPMQSRLADEVIQEELAKGALYYDDFEQAVGHNRKLRIYRQFFGGPPPAEGVRLGFSKGDTA